MLVTESLADAPRVTVQMTPVGFKPTPELDLSPGLSIATGINNVGKSRLLRQLAALRNQNAVLDRDLRVAIDWGTKVGTLTVSPTASTQLARWVVTISASRPPVFDVVIQRGTPQGLERTGTSAQALMPPPLTLGKLLDTQALGCFQRLTPVDAIRDIPSNQPTTPTTDLRADGSNLAQVLLYHSSHRTPQHEELEHIMGNIFPETAGVLVAVTGEHRSTIKVRDRYARADIDLDECGTGVGQVLYFITLVLCSPPHRIFLVDEPAVHLHAGGERALAGFLRSHPEHSYVVATHSPIFIDASDPDRLWHLTRDEAGSRVHALLGPDNVQRRDAFRTLGWRPSQFAWADRVVFVEGESDEQVYSTWFERWGWVKEVSSCPVVNLGGSGNAREARRLAARLAQYVALDYRLVLDGDQRTEQPADSPVLFQPEPDLETLLLRDVAAVRSALLEAARVTTDVDADLDNEWPLARVEEELNRRADPKGADRLRRLAHRMGVAYNKREHGRAIAQRVDLALLEDLRHLFEPFVRSGDKA